MRLGVNARFLGARPTGVQRFARELVRALAGAAEPTLLVPRGIDAAENLPAGLPVVAGALPGPVWEQVELPRAARRAGVDVVLHPASSAPCWGGPHVVVLHDVLPLVRPDDFTRRYRLWARIAHVAAARRAAAVVTVSEWSADRIAEHAGIPRARITVVPQGAGPLDRPATPERVAEARRRHRLDEPYFLAVTGGDPRKGAAFLEEVWAGWADADRPRLVLVGGAHAHVHRARTPRPDGPGVRRLGHVPDEDLRALYTGAIALLHAAPAEGFGRPPLEALACGTRVVVAPYGPAREVLGDHAAVVPLEADRWRACLARLLCEPADERAERVRSGMRHAERFDWAVAARTILDVCADCARSPR